MSYIIRGSTEIMIIQTSISIGFDNDFWLEHMISRLGVIRSIWGTLVTGTCSEYNIKLSQKDEGVKVDE